MTFGTALRAAVVAALVSSLPGCASLRGTWYYQSDALAKHQVLFLTIVNDLDYSLPVNTITINDRQDAGTPSGWRCSGRQIVSPGQLILLTLPMDSSAQCTVPVDATLHLDGKKTIPVRLPGLMPSALPSIWHSCATKGALASALEAEIPDVASGNGTPSQPPPSPYWQCVARGPMSSDAAQ